MRKRFSRVKVLEFFANLPPCLIGMEACPGAHYWARELMKLGHAVKLMAAQYVKAYVKGNKNDGNDGAAICEAVSRPGMRFVAINTEAQQDTQMLHRIRSRLVAERTALINQVRGLLGEYGIVFAQGPSQVRRGLAVLLAEEDPGSPGWPASSLPISTGSSGPSMSGSQTTMHGSKPPVHGRAQREARRVALHRPADRHSAGRCGQRW